MRLKRTINCFFIYFQKNVNLKYLKEANSHLENFNWFESIAIAIKNLLLSKNKIW